MEVADFLADIMTEEPEDVEAKEDVAAIFDNMQATADYLGKMFTKINAIGDKVNVDTRALLAAAADEDGPLLLPLTASNNDDKLDAMSVKLQGLEKLLEAQAKLLEEAQGSTLDVQVQIVSGSTTMDRKFLCLTNWNGAPVEPASLEVSAWSDQAEDDVLVDSVEQKTVRMGKTLLKIPNAVVGYVFNVKVVLSSGVERHVLVTFSPAE